MQTWDKIDGNLLWNLLAGPHCPSERLKQVHRTGWFSNLKIEAITKHYQSDTEIYVHSEENASVSQRCLRDSKEMYKIGRERRRGFEKEARKKKGQGKKRLNKRSKGITFWYFKDCISLQLNLYETYIRQINCPLCCFTSEYHSQGYRNRCWEAEAGDVIGDKWVVKTMPLHWAAWKRCQQSKLWFKNNRNIWSYTKQGVVDFLEF